MSTAHAGEVDEASGLMVISAAEIDRQIATAKEYPRDIKRFRATATELVTLDEETAGECIYAKPVDGNYVKGASVRFAEILAHSFGNLRVGARIVDEGEKFITAQGVCVDLETNNAQTADVKRRITTKSGKRYGASMIETACAAACAIARRNAILSCVPKPLWRSIYNAARDRSIGDAKTLPERRKSMFAHFSKLGVTPAMILAKLGLQTVEEVELDQLETLRGLATAIKDGEAIDEVFGNGESEVGGKVERSPITDQLTGSGDGSHPKTDEGELSPAELAKMDADRKGNVFKE